MKYDHFQPPTDTAPAGPSKEDLLMQLEADHHAAKGNPEEQERLDAIYRKVKAASKADAAKAYRDGHANR